MDKVVHFELPAGDAERAQKFYKGIFDWNIFKYEGDMPYWIVRTVECDDNNMPKEAGAINGGLFEKDAKQQISPILVINVPDIDAYMKKIKEAGGSQTTEKTEISNMGYYARFKDTEGNELGLWEDIKK